ncbi:hypothetical protein B7463_g9780, partial [Scytalidium lignicola]
MVANSLLSTTICERSNKKVMYYCFVVGLGAILFGLDQGETTGFLAMPRFLEDFGYYDEKLKAYNMSANDQAIIYGVQLAFVCVSCIISGPIGAQYGRRVGLALCAITSIIGPAVQASVTTFAGIVVGRSISGFGIGFAANFVITYWSEAAPVELRGLIVVMYQGLINVAQFVGAAINEGTSGMPTRWAYRAPLLTELAAPLALLAFMFFIPDTPRWYISRGNHDEGLDALRKLRGDTYPEEEIEQEIRLIAAFVEIERELEGSSSFMDCFRGTDRQRTAIVIMVLVFQQLTGIGFITAFGTYFFTITGISNPFVATVITSACGMAGSASAFALIKFFGRRPILITGSAVSAICMLVFAIVGVAAPNSLTADSCLVAFTSIFIYTYGATWGPVAQVVLGEIPSNRLRSKSLAIATALNWLCTLMVVCSLPYLLSDSYVNLGTKVGFIFGGCNVLSFFWALFCLPETKDRTLEQIDEMFLNKVPILKFKHGHKATNGHNSATKATKNGHSEPANEDSMSIHINNIEIRGFILSNCQVRNFLNTPFARIPARFRQAKLVDPRKEKGVIDATKYGPRRPQPSMEALILMVMEAVNLTATSSYGRSISLGKPIVVVSINYRLGYFGCLSSKELRDEAVELGEVGYANQGLIHFFGGDGFQLTAAGESAGAFSVLAHLRSNFPAFQQAFIISCPTGSLHRPDNRQEIFDRLVASTGIAASAPAADKIAALRSLMAKEIEGLLDGNATPAFDDKFWVDQDLTSSLEDGPFSSWVKTVVVGITKDENALFSQLW